MIKKIIVSIVVLALLMLFGWVCNCDWKISLFVSVTALLVFLPLIAKVCDEGIDSIEKRSVLGVMFGKYDDEMFRADKEFDEMLRLRKINEKKQALAQKEAQEKKNNDSLSL